MSGEVQFGYQKKVLHQSQTLEWAFQRSGHSIATRFQEMFGKYCWAHGETPSDGVVQGQELALMFLIRSLPTWLILSFCDSVNLFF